MENNGGNSTPNRLEDIINMEWLVQQYSQQQEINARLMQGIAAIQASLQTPGSSESTVPSAPETIRGVSEGSRKPKHTLSHPNKFNGQDRAAYPAFKGYLKVKFRIDSAAIGGETEKVWYGYGYLSDKAAERIFPWIASTEERGKPLRVDDFFAQMDAAFDDPQSAQRALEWINSKKQGNQPFQEFLQEFEQKLLEAGGWEFSDGVRKGYLRSAVSRKIKEKLVAVEEPAKYEDFVNQLRRTSDNLTELDRLGSKRGTWARSYDETDKSNSMDWEPTPKVASGSAPNHHRDNRPSAKWATKETLDQRRLNQECLRCGGADHFINKCRLGPATRPESKDSKTKRRTQVAATSEATPKPSRKARKQEAVVEELSSDLGSESDSGNE
jgi:hypothetical protein